MDLECAENDFLPMMVQLNPIFPMGWNHHNDTLVLVVQLHHHVPQDVGLGHKLGLVASPHFFHACFFQGDKTVILKSES